MYRRAKLDNELADGPAPGCGCGVRFPAPVLFFLVLTMAALFSQAAEPAKPEGVEIVSIEGKAQFSRKGALQWQGATNGIRLANGDLFRTLARSRATLKWSDLSTLRVDELTTLEVRPPGPKARTAGVEVKSGAGYFFSREKPAEIQF